MNIQEITDKQLRADRRILLILVAMVAIVILSGYGVYVSVHTAVPESKAETQLKALFPNVEIYWYEPRIGNPQWFAAVDIVSSGFVFVGSGATPEEAAKACLRVAAREIGDAISN